MSGDSLNELPAAPPLATVADGVNEDGMRWEIKAGGTPEHCISLLNIELTGGRVVGGGGLGGPALPPGQVLVLSVHKSDPDLHYLVGRVRSDVRRVHLEFSSDHPGFSMQPVGLSPELGVAFVAAVLPEAVDLVSATAFDAGGNSLGSRKTANYGTFFQIHNRQANGAPEGDRHVAFPLDGEGD